MKGKVLFFILSVIAVSTVCLSYVKSMADRDEQTEEEKVVYLTFDDGPSRLTEQVLDILKENNVKATFFLIGNQVNDGTKQTVKRMIDEGHQVGVHTYSHEPAEIYKNSESFYNDILKAEQTIIEKTGAVPTVYRFPYGSNNCYVMRYRNKVIKKLKKLGLTYIDWNVSGEDSIGNPTPKMIISNIKANYNRYNQPVVLLHDSAGRKATVDALPKIIKMYKKDGYSFGLIKNRYRPYQWNVK